MKAGKATSMMQIAEANGYRYYRGVDTINKPYYNVVPLGAKAPRAGYYNPEWICKVKSVPNLFY